MNLLCVVLLKDWHRFLCTDTAILNSIELKVPAEVPLVNIIPTYHSSEKENILEFIITFRKK